MSDSDRMEAVKRAYAEIILNTAAESAARILASERKALGFQQSLEKAKQDAVDMMVRMKSLMDSKIQEAETRNTLHARRIQELESQLLDAQGTILSLKTDLERERNNNHKNKENPSTEEENANDNCDDISSSSRNETTGDSSSEKDLKDSCTDLKAQKDAKDTGTDLDAKVRVRNGCAQRIIALDQSKDPKGDQVFVNKKDATKNKSEENAKNISLRRGPPRKSRSNCDYVKISKFGITNNEDSPKKAKNGPLKCAQNDESESKICSDFDADEPVAITQEAIQVPDTANPKLQDSNKLETPVANLLHKIEDTFTPINETEGGLRSIKYTFARKRKRNPLDNNNNNNNNNNNESESVPIVVLDENKEEENKSGNSEEDGNKKNKDEKRNKKKNKDIKGGEKRSLRLKNKSERMLLDSPRSNRRMVQVARQLVSLSTRKW